MRRKILATLAPGSRFPGNSPHCWMSTPTSSHARSCGIFSSRSRTSSNIHRSRSAFWIGRFAARLRCRAFPGSAPSAIASSASARYWTSSRCRVPSRTLSASARQAMRPGAGSPSISAIPRINRTGSNATAYPSRRCNLAIASQACSTVAASAFRRCSIAISPGSSSTPTRSAIARHCASLRARM